MHAEILEDEELLKDVAELISKKHSAAWAWQEEIQKRMVACRADKNFDQLATAASLRGYKDQAVTAEQMAAVRVPTLGIVGTLDHTLKDMQELKKIRPDMKLMLLEGVSHTGKTGIQENPALVTEIRKFIAEQPRAAAPAY